MNTPTPWKYLITDTDKPVVTDSDFYSIARTVTNSKEQNLENAKLIVRAVNYHDRLVECLTDLHAYSKGKYKKNPQQLYMSVQQLLNEIKESK